MSSTVHTTRKTCVLHVLLLLYESFHGSKLSCLWFTLDKRRVSPSRDFIRLLSPLSLSLSLGRDKGTRKEQQVLRGKEVLRDSLVNRTTRFTPKLDKSREEFLFCRLDRRSPFQSTLSTVLSMSLCSQALER